MDMEQGIKNKNKNVDQSLLYCLHNISFSWPVYFCFEGLRSITFEYFFELDIAATSSTASCVGTSMRLGLILVRKFQIRNFWSLKTKDYLFAFNYLSLSLPPLLNPYIFASFLYRQQILHPPNVRDNSQASVKSLQFYQKKYFTFRKKIYCSCSFYPLLPPPPSHLRLNSNDSIVRSLARSCGHRTCGRACGRACVRPCVCPCGRVGVRAYTPHHSLYVQLC